jgi:FAD/FMN-containing dehydrogenase
MTEPMASRRAAAAAMAALTQARADGRLCVPRGAGRRAPPPDTAVVWDSRAFAGVDRLAADELVVEVAAGTTVDDLNRLLEPHRLWLPAGLADGPSDTLGGLVGAGVRGLWGGYGAPVDRLLAVDVLTPAYGVVRLGASVVKNVAGYNLLRLYWGTGASFGIVLTLTWKLAPRPAETVAYQVRGSLDDLLPVARRWRDQLPGWASLLLVHHGGGWRLSGVFHGRPAALARVQRQVGAEAEAVPADLAVRLPAPATWQGHWLLTEWPEVLRQASADGWDLAAEMGSGVIYGLGRALSQPPGEWARRARRFGEGAGQEGPGTARDAWQRIKAAVDPSGVLPAWGGSGEGEA